MTENHADIRAELQELRSRIDKIEKRLYVPPELIAQLERHGENTPKTLKDWWDRKKADERRQRNLDELRRLNDADDARRCQGDNRRDDDFSPITYTQPDPTPYLSPDPSPSIDPGGGSSGGGGASGDW